MVAITDSRFIAPLNQQLVETDRFGGDAVEFAASVIQGIQPRDHLEVMLAAQMAVLHRVTMKFIGQIGGSGGTANQEVAVATATRLARTFTAQMEALNRYRTGGEHTVNVQNVSVSEGGQAIVGNITQTPREITADEAAADSPLALSDAKAAPMPIMGKSEGRAAVSVWDRSDK